MKIHIGADNFSWLMPISKYVLTHAKRCTLHQGIYINVRQMGSIRQLYSNFFRRQSSKYERRIAQRKCNRRIYSVAKMSSPKVVLKSFESIRYESTYEYCYFIATRSRTNLFGACRPTSAIFIGHELNNEKREYIMREGGGWPVSPVCN